MTPKNGVQAQSQRDPIAQT